MRIIAVMRIKRLSSLKKNQKCWTFKSSLKVSYKVRKNIFWKLRKSSKASQKLSKLFWKVTRAFWKLWKTFFDLKVFELSLKVLSVKILKLINDFKITELWKLVFSFQNLLVQCSRFFVSRRKFNLYGKHKLSWRFSY